MGMVYCIKIGGHVALLSDPTVYPLYCGDVVHCNTKFRDLCKQPVVGNQIMYRRRGSHWVFFLLYISI